MAPTKFEKHIKKQLEGRQIEPSSDAWSRLESELEQPLDSSKNPKLFWYAIAASLIGVIFVLSFFFKNDPDLNTTNPVIVDVDDPENSSITKQAVEPEDSLKITPQELSSPIEDREITMETETAIVENKIPKIEDLPEQEINDPLSAEDQKVLEVVAQIQELQKTQEVTDAEIDSLLAQAERELQFENFYNYETETVNADALLQDVEKELERSFRDKVFETLKKGYKEIKTAVAQRNNDNQ